nr:hypothetical protein [Pelagibius litoralis]
MHNPAPKVPPGVDFQFRSQARLGGVEFGHGRQNKAIHNTRMADDAKGHDGIRLHLLKKAGNIVDRRKNANGLRIEKLTLRRWHQPFPVTVKERAAEFLLKNLQKAAGGRLTQIEFACCPDQGALFHHMDENAEALQIHIIDFFEE